MLEVDGARRLGNETFFSAPQIKSNPLGSSRVNNPFEFLPDEIPNAIKALARPLTGPDDGQLAWSHLGAREKRDPLGGYHTMQMLLRLTNLAFELTHALDSGYAGKVSPDAVIEHIRH